jgi:hypothetical protein
MHTKKRGDRTLRLDDTFESMLSRQKIASRGEKVDRPVGEMSVSWKVGAKGKERGGERRSDKTRRSASKNVFRGIRK